MLRKLLIITCLFAGVKTYAQDNLVPIYLPDSKPIEVVDDGDKSNFTNMGSPLPKFKLVTLPQGTSNTENGTAVRKITIPSKNIINDNVKNDANLLVMVFNPTCGHCEDQTDTLEKYIYLFKKSNMVMVCAPTMGPYLEQFEKDHQTSQFPTLQIGMDASALIRKIFLYTNLPQINIYNKDRKLIKTFTGGAVIDSLRGYIQ